MSDVSRERAVMKALADNPIVHPDEIAVEVPDELRVRLMGLDGQAGADAEAAALDALIADDELRVRSARR